MLSFIIPLYNCLGYTREMLASLTTTVPAGVEYEIILVDDGSTDGTREWLATLTPPIRVVLNEANLGYGAANNRGAAIAAGELFVLLNNDLFLSPGWLEPMLAAHRSLGESAGLVGNVQKDAVSGAVDHAGIFFNLKGKPEHDRSARGLERVRRCDAVTGACMLTSAWLWKHLGGFDEGYRNGCEDVDLCLRARAAGRVNAVALDSVVQHHISTSPGRKLRDEENTVRLVRRWRSDIITLAGRTWARHCLRDGLLDRGQCPQPSAVVQSCAFLLGLRAAPPDLAIHEVTVALEVELERWQSMGIRT